MNLRDSFWLVPTITLLCSVLLAVGLVAFDIYVDADLGERWPRLFGAGAEAARGTLSAIASSMITVAGVVFSVTIVSLSLAASTYSPRVLRTFMHDRPTQLTFGVLVGIYAYCLVVLGTIRSADEGNGFVPEIAVLGALLFALAGVLVLVYFIHHVAVVIQAPTILERISYETGMAVDHLFPDELGQGEDDHEEPPLPCDQGPWRAVPASKTGYIVHLDKEGLLDFARRRATVVRMELGVGEFAIATQPLASLACDTSDPERDARELNALFTMGRERTIDQDAAFGVRQIVSVAERALSPGVNDPSTAMMCIDRLNAVFVRMGQRRIPSRLRTADGELRVIAKGPTFESLTALAFESLTHHAAGEPEVLAALERAARSVARATSPQRKLVMHRHIEAIDRARNAS